MTSVEHTAVTTIPTNARVDGRLVLASGFALLDVDSVFTVEIGPLQLEFVFVDDDGTEMAIEPEPIDSQGLRLRLKNFKNPLGSTIGPAPIGSLGGRGLHVALYISAVGDRKRASFYSILCD
jgi:hypothetical protein